MKETKVNINDIEVILKKEYLTNAELNFLVGNAIAVYMDSDKKDIDGYGFSPLSAFYNFYDYLFYDCIKDFDLEDKDMFDNLYNHGVHHYLIENIINAKEAYDIFVNTMKQAGTLESVLQTGIQKIGSLLQDKLPTKEELKKTLDKLPQEWKNVVSEYSRITGVSEKEDAVK